MVNRTRTLSKRIYDNYLFSLDRKDTDLRETVVITLSFASDTG